MLFSLKSFTLFAVTLYIMASIISNLHAWIKPGFTLNTQEAGGLLAFLHQHQLNNGYGPDWGSFANAITWLDYGKTRVRAVTFSPKDGSLDLVTLFFILSKRLCMVLKYMAILLCSSSFYFLAACK